MAPSGKHPERTNATGGKAIPAKQRSGVWSQKSGRFSPCYPLSKGIARKNAKVSLPYSCFFAFSIPSWPKIRVQPVEELCAAGTSLWLFTSVLLWCKVLQRSYSQVVHLPLPPKASFP